MSDIGSVPPECGEHTSNHGARKAAATEMGSADAQKQCKVTQAGSTKASTGSSATKADNTDGSAATAPDYIFCSYSSIHVMVVPFLESIRANATETLTSVIVLDNVEQVSTNP